MQGYTDALCERIGRVVVAAVEEPDKKISLHFDDGVVLDISLAPEDRPGEEAVMFQDGTGKLWSTW
jgi:hypothetical protein